MKKRGGFTLLELLVFIGIFSFIIIYFIVIFVAAVQTQGGQVAFSQAAQQGQFLLQQIQYYVQNTRLIDMTLDSTTSALTLRESSAALDPTLIYLASGTVYLAQGASSSTALSSNKVTISGLSFTRHFNLNSTSSPYGTESVSFSFTVNASTSNATTYSQLFQSSAAVFLPIGKIPMIQQAKTDNNSASGITSIAGTYTTANETSSLLIAVGSYTGLVTSSISDTAGNTWTKIASTTYTSSTVAIYDAVNAKNASNTVTLRIGGSGGGFASLFLYEYRGAATSSSFDASSTQAQSNNASPSSGSANPTSGAELLFGVNMNENPPAAPLPGVSYTIESSSTVSDVFIEDENQYITGPVAATWSYGSAVSSSATIVTFK